MRKIDPVRKSLKPSDSELENVRKEISEIRQSMIN